MNIDVATEQSNTFSPSTDGQTLEQGNRLRMPTATKAEESRYWGAKVFDPQPGKHHNVIYGDLWSLYPNIMRTLNISKETIIGTQDDLDESEYDESDCVWGWIDDRPVKRVESHEDVYQFTTGDYKFVYKYSKAEDSYKKKWEDPDGPQTVRCYFLKPPVRKGVIAEMIDDFMELKAKTKGTDKYAATKAIVNSAYGTVGYSTNYNTFRLFDHRMAEAITIVGRMIIQHTAHYLMDHIETHTGRETYLTHGDTDGVGIAQPGAEDQSEAMRAMQEAMSSMNGGDYRNWFMGECGLSEDDEIWMEVEPEYFAPSVYCHDSKKRYAIHRQWDEGEDADDISVTGFECVRSDVSDITQGFQYEVLETILRKDEPTAKSKLYEQCREIRGKVLNGEIPLDQLGVRGGIGKDLDSYGTADRTPQPIYRGAKWANQHIPGEEGLGEGSKPMQFPVESVVDNTLPSTYSADTAEDGDQVDAVAVENPAHLEGVVEVSMKTILEKQVVDRVQPIFDTMGWSWDDAIAGTEDASIEDYL